MDKKMTELKQVAPEHIKRFWARCGVEPRAIVPSKFEYEHGIRATGAWEYPDIDLNNLSQWAVPVLARMGIFIELSNGSGDGWLAACKNYGEAKQKPDFDLDVPTVLCDAAKPEIALFWACYKAFELEK